MSALFRGTELVCTGAKTFHGIKLLRYWPVSVCARAGERRVDECTGARSERSRLQLHRRGAALAEQGSELPVPVFVAEALRGHRMPWRSPHARRRVATPCDWARRAQDPSWTAPNPCKEQSIPGLLNITTPMAVGPSVDPNGTAGAVAGAARLYVSRPHFCACDASLRAGVAGLPPCVDVEEKLSVWLDVEPLTGELHGGGSCRVCEARTRPGVLQVTHGAVLPTGGQRLHPC